MKENQKIILSGQLYTAPKAESVEIVNQGVLCGSDIGETEIFLGVSKGGLN